MLPVVGLLLFPAAGRLVHGGLHGGRYRIRIQDDMPARIAGGTAERLNQRAGGSQKALFVRIQNADQGHLRNVQTFSQKINPHKYIKYIQSKISHNF